MKVVLREDESGISEVVGTILILAMTVILFSTIIVWVSSFPTPVAQTRADMIADLTPQYNAAGTQVGDWINVTHQGGESLVAASTLIYVTDEKSGGTTTTDVARLHTYQCTWLCSPTPGTTGTSNGLLDGTGASWDVGQRFAYYSSNLSVADTITVTVVDSARGVVVWTSQLSAPAGSYPPIFLNVWASPYNGLSTVSTPLTGQPMYLFAQVMDPDSDLIPTSVYANVTVLWGTNSVCKGPQQMLPSGETDVYVLARTSCLDPSVTWDGTLVLFNARDTAGHVSTTRLTLHVLPGPNGGTTGPGFNGTTGRPPYLFWNGQQGYNIFNLTQWSQYTSAGLSPSPTRSFKPGDTVVIVVGSSTLEDISSADSLNLLDPFSGTPQQSVVYGTTKTVTLASAPSSLQAFNFYQFVNGYYVYTYQFTLNPSSGAANYYTFGSAPHPPYYYFARYPLSIYLKSSAGTVFSATDSINITSTTGAYQEFPQITTYKDPAFTQPTTSFRSTSTMYVKVQMLSANQLPQSVNMGTVMIVDYNGETQLWRAPINGYQSNLPICPVSGPCSSGTAAISTSVAQNAYFFAVNLSRVNQNPWIPGTQYYSFGLTSIQDTDENYGAVNVQIQVTAPLYKMDVVVGTPGAGTNAWGTSNYLYYFQNYNGYDWWKPLRVDWCSGTGTSTSGIPGNGKTCPAPSVVTVRFGNFFNDGTLGIAESISTGGSYAVEMYRRTVDATGSVVYLPVFNAPVSQPLPEACNAIAVGDVTGVGAQSVICGGTDGKVWYYRNDGNWTFVWVDQVGSGHSISSISVGDFNGDGWKDIAVVGSGGFVAWYPNLGNGLFQNPGFSTTQPVQAETNTYGTVVQGNYLNTYPSATSPEILKEQTVAVPLQTGATTNEGFASGIAPWTYAAIQGATNGSWASSGGVTGGYAYASTSAAGSATGAGFWSQSFSTSGSQPYTLTLNLSYKVFSFSGANAKLFAFVSASAAAPPANPTSGYAWASSLLSSSTGWVSIQVPYTSANWTNPTKIPSPGTYYLQLEIVTAYGASGGAVVVGFDSVQISWISTPGPTSALQHYWNLGTMPIRPGITFSFVLSAQGNASSDFDNYTFAYSTNVVGNDPTTGTYTTIRVGPSGNVTSSLTTANVSFTQNLQGLGVWIRVMDTDRVANSAILDTLTVNRLYVYTFTPSSSTTIQVLSGPSATYTVTSSNAGDYNSDGISDLVVGTAEGAVYLYSGSKPTGLNYNGISEWTGSPVVSVKFGNILGNVSKYGLQIVVATATNVYFVDPSTRTTFGNPIGVSPSQGPITAMGVGDVNGDGVDDVVVGTGGGSGTNVYGYVLFYANFGTGYSWSPPVLIYDTGALTFYNLAIGDAANNLYVGR